MDNAQPSQPARAGVVVDNLTEVAGCLCIVAFSYFVWPPLPLLVAGVGLVFTANVRAARRKPRDPNRLRLAERIARALAAYRGTP